MVGVTPTDRIPGHYIDERQNNCLPRVPVLLVHGNYSIPSIINAESVLATIQGLPRGSLHNHSDGARAQRELAHASRGRGRDAVGLLFGLPKGKKLHVSRAKRA